MVKVVKFGGSSLASAEQFAKVGENKRGAILSVRMNPENM